MYLTRRRTSLLPPNTLLKFACILFVAQERDQFVCTDGPSVKNICLQCTNEVLFRNGSRKSFVVAIAEGAILFAPTSRCVRRWILEVLFQRFMVALVRH